MPLFFHQFSTSKAKLHACLRVNGVVDTGVQRVKAAEQLAVCPCTLNLPPHQFHRAVVKPQHHRIKIKKIVLRFLHLAIILQGWSKLKITVNGLLPIVKRHFFKIKTVLIMGNRFGKTECTEMQ
ncbi:hypothetical protein [Glaesserella parasuis]|uniref:hypothetical protein n=1 Tax=Glaesserella parasuis TaxID=738 RepID=UPI001038DA89|nr:hypothetical protein [Glaesserella parasuis]MCT8704202.1 hypothetical protein [Glaesserella parasuis]MCT8705403.1 hypothetical protein [Glaesserella parasuis]MCT8708316.1 hypothetical protein [Glaesserella parasuis]MCT8712537.1 hypothetical protein [Glaesserella parasuis]MCT8714821.1 hypothetical protein [Glaesserella parasuis]